MHQLTVIIGSHALSVQKQQLGDSWETNGQPWTRAGTVPSACWLACASENSDQDTHSALSLDIALPCPVICSLVSPGSNSGAQLQAQGSQVAGGEP